MSNARPWIAVLATVVFLAGMASGLLIAERARPREISNAPFADFRREFVARFGLDPERERLFADLLRHYGRELDDIRQRHLAASLSAMEDELAAAGLRYRDSIRNHVLPEARRAEFDALAQTWNPVL